MGRAALAVMHDCFVYGALHHAAMLDAVLGRKVDVVAATLHDYVMHHATDIPTAWAVPRAGGMVNGSVLQGLRELDLARLEFYLTGFGFYALPLRVQTTQGVWVTAKTFTSDRNATAGAEWNRTQWLQHHAAEDIATARDFMAHFGVKQPGAVAARYRQLQVRGAARLRAANAPATLRHNCIAADVQIVARREPYAFFFAVEEYDLAFRRFDGAPSPQVTRAAFISGDAVTVLPYDPLRDRVLVIEQFRAGPYARGDAQPWQFEAIAGRIDPGETPEAAARREAEEEAGLALDSLLPVAQYYPSPGICAEFLYSYVAITDLPDSAAGVFGVAGEAEDIRGHLLSFDGFMALIASGEISTAPLIMTGYWLEKQRAALRAV